MLSGRAFPLLGGGCTQLLHMKGVKGWHHINSETWMWSTSAGRISLALGVFLQNSLLLMTKAFPLSYPLSDLLFFSNLRCFFSLFYPSLLDCVSPTSPHTSPFIFHLSNPSILLSPVFCLIQAPALLSTFPHLCPPSLFHLPQIPLVFSSVWCRGRERTAPVEEVVLPHQRTYASDTFPLRWQPLEASRWTFQQD